MTRVTNFGRKRTYVEAGFAEVDDHRPTNPPASAPPAPEPAAASASAEPKPSTAEAGPSKPKKQKGEPTPPVPRKHPKRHRSKKGKGPGAGKNIPRAEREAAAAAAVEEEAKQKENRWAYAKANGEPDAEKGVYFLTGANGESTEPVRSKEKRRENKEGSSRGLKPGKGSNSVEARSEQRRLARKQEKLMNTTCFACREKGHAAKDCPKAAEIGGEGAETAGKDGKAKAVTGICYRCGSNKHNLSRCKKPADPENPLPFASCFVCSGTGHIAGSCPQNQNKGVYPNGGCCKICGDTTHLAKECAVRRNETLDVKGAVGTGFGAGADEDDFMVLKRRTKEVEKEEHKEERLNQLLTAAESALGALSRRKPAVAPVKRKVVVF